MQKSNKHWLRLWANWIILTSPTEEIGHLDINPLPPPYRCPNCQAEISSSKEVWIFLKQPNRLLKDALEFQLYEFLLEIGQNAIWDSNWIF